MIKLPKITIVTPNFNGGKFIEETIISVIGQNYPNLEYIVVDGASTDGSIDKIRKYEKQIIWWVSEPDNGMYNAIQKGFDRSTGEIMGWINSDDILQKNSLFALADIFSGNNQIQWIQGYPNVIDEQGRIIFHRPPRFDKYEFYLKSYHDGIFIQQESTFWRRDLWALCGGQLSDKCKYAGDFELWMRFFRFADLYNTKSFLGSFRIHGSGQRSREYYSEYLSECDDVISDIVKKLTPSEKKHLCQIKILRKVKTLSPLVYKILHVNKLGNRYLSKPFMVDFDITSNKFFTR
jgi:glycosyltransferase involved in cell wall biosynthesis